MRKDRRGGSGFAHGYSKGRVRNIQAGDLQDNGLPTWQWEMGEEDISVVSGDKCEENIEKG